MYLKKLHINNFRCFNDYTIEFAPRVSVLFGKNGSGKTTLIHAIHKALSFMMHSEKIKGKDPKTKKLKVVAEKTLRGGNPYVSVEGFSKTGEAHYDGVKRADYSIDIKAEATLDEQTQIEWGMSVYYIDNRLRTSEYRDAFNQLYDWHIKTGNRALLAYYSDGYPHYSNVIKSKKENSKEAFLVKSFDESIGYTDWNSEVGCTNTWLVRLETQIRVIEYAKRQIETAENNDVRKVALDELEIAEKEVSYITDILKTFSRNDSNYAINNIRISPYDACLQIIAMNGKPYSFRKLPAGYKRMYYIALDLAYRSFFLTNGKMKDIGGVVIIDEIDLHLHPELEKVVLKRFMDTFPNLQFIVSTHSPLVLTGVETVEKKNRILKMDSGQSTPEVMFDIYGLDLNSGLQEIMDVNPNDDELNRWISRCAYMRSKGYQEQADNLKTFIVGKELLTSEEIEKRINQILKQLN